MNEKAVKELTKKGCIVEKEAAEELTEDDLQRIKQLDSPPMYLSEKMLDVLRNKELETKEKEVASSGSQAQVMKTGNGGPMQKVEENTSEVEETDTIENNTETNSQQAGEESEDEELFVDGSEEEQDLEEDRSEQHEEARDEAGTVDSEDSVEIEDSSEESKDEQESTEDQEEEEVEEPEGEVERKGSKYSESKAVRIKDERRREGLSTKVDILDEADISKEEKDVPEFLQNYNDRYDRAKKLLLRRTEMQSAVSIQRLSHRDQGDEAVVVGMVNDKYSTSSGKWMVEIEDKTDQMKVLVDERDGERIVPDEVIGIRGSLGEGIIFANSVVRPDMPIPDGVTTTDQKVKAAYISDIHLGSVDTLYDRFDRFAKWLNSAQASDVGYLVMPGDMVEGVGIYPGQEEELQVADIYKQYKMFEEWVKKLPEDLQIIVGPGNHDIVRLAEPQPRLPEDALPTISSFDNVHLVQNPQYVKLHAIESKGILNLMYHGYSFDDHVDQIQDLREKAYDDPHHVMIDLLKRRHLAPTFGSNLLAPEDRDYMVIEREPDIMTSGHFHSHSCESYKGVTTICASSFQAQTDFQKRVGHVPDPGKVTVVDYKTRKTEVKQF